MLPKTLALIDDDKEYSDGLARYLRERGVAVDAFADSNDLLAHVDPFGYDFYVTDLTLPGVDGADLIKVLRLRTKAGVVVVSGRLAQDTFKEVITAGADMYLAKPVQFEQVGLAIEAVMRRAGAADPQGNNIWRMDRRIGQLLAPDGSRIDLSESERTVVDCFIEAQGEVVARSTLLERLGRAQDVDASASLNAVVYRLRRRIEGATAHAMPLSSKSGVGYVFRAPLKVI